MQRQNRYPSLRKQCSSMRQSILLHWQGVACCQPRHLSTFKAYLMQTTREINETCSSVAIPCSQSIHRCFFFSFFAFIIAAHIKTIWKTRRPTSCPEGKHCPCSPSRCDGSLRAQFCTNPKIYICSRRLPPGWMDACSKPPNLYIPGFPTCKMGN